MNKYHYFIEANEMNILYPNDTRENQAFVFSEDYNVECYWDNKRYGFQMLSGNIQKWPIHIIMMNRGNDGQAISEHLDRNNEIIIDRLCNDTNVEKRIRAAILRSK